MTVDSEVNIKNDQHFLQSSGVSELDIPQKNKASSSFRKNFHLYFNVSLAVLSTYFCGYATGVLAPTYVSVQKDNSSIINRKVQSHFVTVILTGATVGSLCSSSIIDRVGRKNTLLINNIIVFIGTILSCISGHLPIFYTARFVSGFAAGVSSAVVSVYVAEISPPEKRGCMGIFRQVSITTGLILAALCAYGLVNVERGWVYAFLIGSAGSILQFILCYWFVESPRWLLSKNREKEAITTLYKLNQDLSSDEIDSLVLKIKLDLEKQKDSASWKEFFKLKYWRVFLIGFGICAFQQMVGINIFVYYSTDILMKLLSHDDAVLWSALIAVPQLLVLVVSFWFIDRFGRKPLIITGLAVMTICAILLGYTFWSESNSLSMNIMAIASMILYKMGYSLSMGSIPFIIASEILPQQIRGKGMSVAMIWNWFANIMSNVVYLPLINAFGQSGTFWFYAGMCVLCICFTIFIIPETKSIPIEDLHKMLINEKSTTKSSSFQQQDLENNNDINPPK